MGNISYLNRHRKRTAMKNVILEYPRGFTSWRKTAIITLSIVSFTLMVAGEVVLRFADAKVDTDIVNRIAHVSVRQNDLTAELFPALHGLAGVALYVLAALCMTFVVLLAVRLSRKRVLIEATQSDSWTEPTRLKA